MFSIFSLLQRLSLLKNLKNRKVYIIYIISIHRMMENTTAAKLKKTDYGSIVPLVLRRLDPRNAPLERHAIALGLRNRFALLFDPFVAVYTDEKSANPNHVYPGGAVIICDPSGETGDKSLAMRKVPITEAAQYCRERDLTISADPETLARFYLFTQLGGTKKEFQQLRVYSDVINGNGKKHLPPETRSRRIYSNGDRDNPQREGLMEVRLVGSNIPSTIGETSHTRRHHMFHPPYAPDGMTLERIAFGRFAQVDPSLIETAERALARYKSACYH